MYTEQELQISNKSYTNKDFQTIYPELLDLVPKLTDKWAPMNSNESDPGVVLLKLGALLADKNNYNIDKNILETFPLSVTQQSNARKLYDMLGYSMGWYKASQATLSFVYTGSKEDLGTTGKITIPKYTMFTDDSSEVVYTLIQDVTINDSGVLYTCNALQGIIKDYEVNGVTTITLDNLDSELRLFFTDKMIAQNGIFISDANKVENTWKIVDNLETQTLNSSVYKFGVMPNTETCYIQFPQDIGNLIGNGLIIKYIITDGESGNVDANKINTFYQKFKVTVSKTDSEGNTQDTSTDFTDTIVVRNTASTVTGEDPETVDSAYRRYKKTIGTFDTLVTLRDYENAAYLAESELGVPYISNGTVSDRTCDINFTTKVKELTNEGMQDTLYIDKDDSTPKMTAYDIGLYVLNPMTSIYDEYYYNRSFSIIDSQEALRSKLDDYNVYSHDFMDTEAIDDYMPYIYKNFYTLRGKLITYYKVTEEQAEEIEKNVKQALFKRYNARNVDFGQPVDYDDIVNTIQNSDTRIKTVILNEPEYEFRYMPKGAEGGSYSESKAFVNNGNQNDDDNGEALFKKILAKMILSGFVQLYKFDDEVTYKFGQTNIQKYSNITKITAKSTIAVGDSGNVAGYTIKKNQNVQFIAPNLYTEKSYGPYVKYILTGIDSISQGQYIRLTGDQVINLTYTDSNNSEKTDSLSNGTIIQYIDTSNPNSTLKNDAGKDTSLSASQTLNVLKPNVKVIQDSDLKCLWFTKDYKKSDDSKTVTYTLFDSGQFERILQDNEYFIYTNDTQSGLVILGSGTLLRRQFDNGVVQMQTQVKASALVSDGINAVTDSDWYIYHAKQNNLTLAEMQIITLAEGAVVGGTIIQKDGQTINAISNDPVEIKDAWYKESSSADQVKLVTYPDAKDTDEITLGWRISSKLNLLMSPDTPQELLEDQSITITPTVVNVDEIKGTGSGESYKSKYVISNKILAFSGGKDLSVTTQDETNIDIYSYDNVGLPYYEVKDVSGNVTKTVPAQHSSDGTVQLKMETTKDKESSWQGKIFEFSFDTTKVNEEHVQGLRTVRIPITLQGKNSTVEVVAVQTVKSGNSVTYKEIANTLITLGFSKNYKQVGYVEYREEDGVRFGGIKIKSWSTAEDISNDTLTIYPINVTINGAGDKDKYSDQLYQTVANTYPNEQVSRILTAIDGYVKCTKNTNNSYNTVSSGNNYTFNLTYKVPQKDLIDTETTSTENINDLFKGNAVWDIKHICNKYTIAQLNTEKLDIQVSPTSIK